MAPEAYWHLEPGGRYRVVRDFHDYDDDLHPAGEEWIFLGANFLPYDDGRSLFVSLDGEHEWHIRMQDRPGAQAHILQDLRSYILQIAPPPPRGD